MFNYYTHYWAHDEINITVNRSIKIATGFYEPVGVDTEKLSDAVGIDELKTHDAYIHPITHRAGFSPNNARFQLSKNFDAASFWALSVDVDPQSLYQNSAILIWNILIKAPPPSKDRFTDMYEKIYKKIINKDVSPCIDDWGADNFIKEFEAIDYVDVDQKKEIIRKLKLLMNI